jgi:hypothetical protein
MTTLQIYFTRQAEEEEDDEEYTDEEILEFLEDGRSF